MKIFGLPISQHFAEECVANITDYSVRLHEERYEAGKRVAHWTFDDFERAVLAALRNPAANAGAARDAVIWATIVNGVCEKILVGYPRERLELIAANGDGRALFNIQRLCHEGPSGESFSAVLGLDYNSALIDDYLHWALSYAIVRLEGKAPYIEWENTDADAAAKVSPA